MKSSVLKKIFIFVLAALTGFGIAQAAAPAPETVMRGNAKFNVVAVVLSIIFAGLAFFLIRLDKRVSKLEKNKNGEAGA